MKYLFALVLGLPLCADAGTIYKCKGADGVMAYQQTQCDHVEAEQGEVRFERAEDSPGLSWSAQARREETRIRMQAPRKGKTATRRLAG